MTTLYIYSMPMCSACEALKKKYKDKHISFVSRKGDRLENDPRIFDDVDREAFLILQMQNRTFPVQLEVESEPEVKVYKWDCFNEPIPSEFNPNGT